MGMDEPIVPPRKVGMRETNRRQTAGPALMAILAVCRSVAGRADCWPKWRSSVSSPTSLIVPVPSS